MRTISLRLDDATDAALRRLAEHLGLTQTDVIKRALDELSHNTAPTPHELATALHMIGAFESNSRDDQRPYGARVRAHLQSRRARDERGAS